MRLYSTSLISLNLVHPMKQGQSSLEHQSIEKGVQYNITPEVYTQITCVYQNSCTTVPKEPLRLHTVYYAIVLACSLL